VAEATISASGVGKRFQLHHKRATSLKERLLLHRRASSEEFWALRDVDLEIGGGLTVGLIGPNGSGKSTLLKVLSGILAPTTGTVAVRGRVASLLELGAGFNGELTGRENVYLNAAILGLSRRETSRQFDDIVAFAELEPFIDNQVKHYSSGQYVRLGFAVAVHVSPDILLVDEVLAVGDESFQRKCLTKIAEFQEQGCTILFVTHSLDLVPRICGRAVVLDHGRVLHDGDPVEATERLRSLLGTAAMIVLSEDVCIVRACLNFTEFYAHESCGKCTPCREGTDWMRKILARLETGQGREQDMDTLKDICDSIFGRSFCALGDGAVSPIVSGLKHFRDEFSEHLGGGCPFPGSRVAVGAH